MISDNNSINRKPVDTPATQTTSAKSQKPEVGTPNEPISCFDPHLQDSFKEEATNILKESANKDVLDLLDENGLFIDDLSKVEDEYLEQLEKEQRLLYIEGENGAASVKYDSDGDGKYDRIVQFHDGKKTSEMLDSDGDGDKELVISYNDDKKVNSIYIDRDDDGNPDSENVVREDGTSSEWQNYEDGGKSRIDYDKNGNREGMVIGDENGVTYASGTLKDVLNDTPTTPPTTPPTTSPTTPPTAPPTTPPTTPDIEIPSDITEPPTTPQSSLSRKPVPSVTTPPEMPNFGMPDDATEPPTDPPEM